MTIQVIDEDKAITEKQTSVTIGSGAEKTIAQQMTVENAEFWGPESPRLYTLRTTLTKPF